LYVKENASRMKSIYDVLGDRTMRAVVSKAFDIPLETAVQSVESQATAFGRKVDVEKFKDKTLARQDDPDLPHQGRSPRPRQSSGSTAQHVREPADAAVRHGRRHARPAAGLVPRAAKLG
jgi:hypothetical protein